MTDSIYLSCYVCGKAIQVDGLGDLEEDEVVVCRDCLEGKFKKPTSTNRSEAIH